MTAHRIPAGAVLLTGRSLDAARYAVRLAQDARRRNGLPPSAALAELAGAVADAVAAPGHTDTPQGGPVEADLVNIEHAAAALGCSTRTARRLAPTLGGRKTGGVWLLDRQAILEHVRGSHL